MVFDFISTEIGQCTDVRPYFSKSGHRVSRKYGHCDVNDALTFAYFKPFFGLRYTAGPDWSRKFVKPMNIDFAFKALRKLAIFQYGGFEFEAVGDKWLHETDEVEKECSKPRKQTPIRQQPYRKGCIGISESSTQRALLLEKVFCVLR